MFEKKQKKTKTKNRKGLSIVYKNKNASISHVIKVSYFYMQNLYSNKEFKTMKV